MDEPFPVAAWKALHEHVWPGYKFPKKAAYNGYLTGAFEIVNIAEDSFTAQSPIAKNLKIVPKEDFFHLAVCLMIYKQSLLKYETFYPCHR